MRSDVDVLADSVPNVSVVQSVTTDVDNSDVSLQIIELIRGSMDARANLTLKIIESPSAVKSRCPGSDVRGGTLVRLVRSYADAPQGANLAGE